jgi:hypothetical protein
MACATPGVMCDVRDNYAKQTPIAPEGKVTIVWRQQQVAGQHGDIKCFDTVNGLVCDMRIRQAPRLGDVCGQSTFGHEILHAMGALHD